MIDKIYFICRVPGNDRYWAQMGALGVMGVPWDRVECFQGIDASDEQFNTFRKIVDGMANDGFQPWEVHRDAKEYSYGPPALAIQWAHLRCLRQIVEHGENAIVLEDDTFLVKPFFEIESALSRLKGVKCVYLWWTHIIEGSRNHQEDDEYQQRVQSTGIHDVFRGYVPCGQRAKFYTTEGAKENLDWWMEHPRHDGESFPWLRNREGRLEGYYFTFPRWAQGGMVNLETHTYKDKPSAQNC